MMYEPERDAPQREQERLHAGQAVSAATPRVETPSERHQPHDCGDDRQSPKAATLMQRMKAAVRNDSRAEVLQSASGSLVCPAGMHADELDLAIVLDTTGSMGAELAELGRELHSLVETVAELRPRLRLALVEYKDYDWHRSPPVRVTDFRSADELGPIVAHLRGARAEGGGGVVPDEEHRVDPAAGRHDPEALMSALEAAETLSWYRGPGLVVIVSDAPPHPTETETALKAARRFASRGIAVSVVECDRFAPVPGLRAVAEAGGGVVVSRPCRLIDAVAVCIQEAPCPR
jgi:hypothetical protein